MRGHALAQTDIRLWLRFDQLPAGQCRVTVLINEALFASLPHARAVLAMWREDYNTTRPHSGLGDLTPEIYAKLRAAGMQRDGTLRSLMGSAPRPVAPPSQTGSNDQQTPLIPGWRLGLRSPAMRD